MHQHPRPSPRSSTPATNPTTNPERTNNPRDQPPTRNRSSVDLTAYNERAGGGNEAAAAAAAGMTSRPEAGSSTSAAPDKESVRLNQIIQQFHTKSALMICGSRAHLPPAYSQSGEKRQNRWFNIIVDETDVLVDDLQEWRRPDLYQTRPPPLVIEVYLDTSSLPHNQALLCVDDNGRPREVVPVSGSEASSASFRNGKTYREIALERWTIEMGDRASLSSTELKESLPSVYKKGIVAFRTLYSTLRMLPAWKLYRQLGRQPGNHHPLRLKFRIRQAHTNTSSHPLSTDDPLRTPLFAPDYGLRGGRSAREAAHASSQTFAHLSTPSGALRTRVDFRLHCDFAVADSESVLSAALLNSDHRALTALTGRSLPGERSEHYREREQYSSTAAPATSRDRPRGLLGAYGSLGTFHTSQQDRRNSTLPISELRQLHLRADSDEEDPTEGMKRIDALRDESGGSPILPPNYFKNGPLYQPQSPRIRETPPSKHGSLTATSPRPLPAPSPRPSPNPIHPPSPQYGSQGKRSSLNPLLPQQHLRNPSTSDAAVASSASSSPKPAPVRYSSSFANRPRRWTSSSKAAESNASSGRGSSDSKEKLLPGSSGSAKTDDDDIASFIKDLETSTNVKFDASAPSSSSSIPRGATINLAKYSSMRSDSAALAEEMSSSSLIQASSTPPSRRLSNVPGLSTSSSPSRVQPHAPHVRSRLSTHSIAEEAVVAASANSGRRSVGLEEEEDDDGEFPFIFQAD